MPKLTAEQSATEAVTRVPDVTAATLNEKNPDGSWKYTDDQLRAWLQGLRGDREVTVAKKLARQDASAKRAAQSKEEELDEEMTDDE